jgi:iron complex transport system ATP-binding protein
MVRLSTKDLSVGYGKTPLLTDLNLSLAAGEVVALLGRNGAGKSTLLKSVTGELRLMSGSVNIDGMEIEHYSRRRLAEKVAIVTTDRMMAGGMTVKEIVGMGRHPHTGIFGLFSDEDRRVVATAMDAVGISYKRDSYFAELSDGERQKCMIARALAQQSPIIILDEPFSFLDPSARIEIMSLLKGIARERDAAVLLSSHDVAQAVRMADKIWLLTADRRIVADTPSNLVKEGWMTRMFDNKNIIFDATQHDFVATNQ